MYDAECRLCPLGGSAATVCVPGSGGATPSPVRVLFVSDHPRAQAEARNAPHGPDLRMLHGFCKDAGLTDYAITYAVKCRPPTTREPGVKVIRPCRAYLLAELDAYKPEIVVPMGNVALRAVCEQRSITKFAGRPTTSTVPGFEGITVFPLVAPSAILKSPSDAVAARFAADFTRLMQVYKGESVNRLYEKVEPSDMAALMRSWAAAPPPHYSIDFETTHLNPRFGEIRTVAVRVGDDTFWTPWSGILVRPLFALVASKARMVAHNAAFEVKWLLHHVVIPTIGEAEARKFEWPVACTQLLHYLLDENPPHALSALSKQFTDKGGYDDEVATFTANGGSYADIDIDTLGQYNAGDADVCYDLYLEFAPQVMGDSGLRNVWRDIMEPALWCVAWAEYDGRRVDPESVDAVRTQLLTEAQAAYDLFTADPAVAQFVKDRLDGDWSQFNPRSADQMRVLFAEFVRVPLTVETDGGSLSVSQKVLEYHAPKFPILRHYLEWKGAYTLENNYLGQYRCAEYPEGKAYLGFVEPDGFLYGSYFLHGTVTGRLASSGPNLQNFHKTLRKIVRSRFPGGKIMEADYSQLELRLVAWLANCAPLLLAFQQNRDAHVVTAALVDGIEESEVTPEQRQERGKRPNFGLTYGAFPKRFAFEFQMDLDEATEIHEKWHAAYPEIGQFLDVTRDDAILNGYLRSMTGRIRRLPDAQLEVPMYRRSDGTRRPDYKHENWKPRQNALMSASNFPVQSLGSDLNTWAAARVRRAMAQAGMRSRQIGFTHDSATYDVFPGEEDRLSEILTDVMVRQVHEHFPRIAVPLAIDIKAGDSWGEVG